MLVTDTNVGAEIVITRCVLLMSEMHRMGAVDDDSYKSFLSNCYEQSAKTLQVLTADIPPQHNSKGGYV